MIWPPPRPRCFVVDQLSAIIVVSVYGFTIADLPATEQMSAELQRIVLNDSGHVHKSR